MYVPARDDEITGLVGYVDQQLAAIRAAAIGLTDEQARLRPCRSALSIGGLIKHVTYGMRGATARLSGDGAGPPRSTRMRTRRMGELRAWRRRDRGRRHRRVRRARIAYLAALAGTDPGAPTTEPPAPWFGIHDARPANARYYLVHQVEELARHAGHADIIREQIDGVSVPRSC